MQAKSTIGLMILVSALILALAAMAASFAAGVDSADGYASRHHEATASPGLGVLESEEFDYFPSHYINQATEIEELPAQF